jgi:hypothetical protein
VNVDLVNDSRALAALCERIVAAPRIALDTEFHTEKHFTPKRSSIRSRCPICVRSPPR